MSNPPNERPATPEDMARFWPDKTPEELAEAAKAIADAGGHMTVVSPLDAREKIGYDPLDRQVLGVHHAAPPVRPRYIVLGLARDVGRWCEENGVRPREVIQVFHLPEKLRGLVGTFEVVRLPSWNDAPRGGPSRPSCGSSRPRHPAMKVIPVRNPHPAVKAGVIALYRQAPPQGLDYEAITTVVAPAVLREVADGLCCGGELHRIADEIEAAHGEEVAGA